MIVNLTNVNKPLTAADLTQGQMFTFGNQSIVWMRTNAPWDSAMAIVCLGTAPSDEEGAAPGFLASLSHSRGNEVRIVDGTLNVGVQ